MKIKSNLFKRIIILLGTIFTLLPSTIFAGPVLIPILGITMTSSGNVVFERTSPNEIEVVAQGIRSETVVDCHGDEQCMAAGIDGQTVIVDEQWRMRIDETTMTVSGEAIGTIQGLEDNIPYEFNGTISGIFTPSQAASCEGTSLEACEVEIQVQGYKFDIGEDCWYKRPFRLKPHTIEASNNHMWALPCFPAG